MGRVDFSFFNHSCDPNLRVYPALTTTWDKRLHRLAFFTRRPVAYVVVVRAHPCLEKRAHPASTIHLFLLLLLLPWRAACYPVK